LFKYYFSDECVFYLNLYNDFVSEKIKRTLHSYLLTVWRWIHRNS